MKRPADTGNSDNGSCLPKTLVRRLADAVARLERLQVERERKRDSGFGGAIENRIVWAELIDLELQEIDQKMSSLWRQYRSEGPREDDPSGPEGRDANLQPARPSRV